ncbi:hypothetical protein [Stenotrophomonas riyadhensis]
MAQQAGHQSADADGRLEGALQRSGRLSDRVEEGRIGRAIENEVLALLEGIAVEVGFAGDVPGESPRLDVEEAQVIQHPARVV